MSLAWETVGVVHLRDLIDRYRWETRKLPAYLDRLGGALGGLEVSSVRPPRRLIVLNRAEDVELWGRFRCWLSQASELHLVICHYESCSAEQCAELERRTLTLLACPSVIRVLHWHKGAEAPEPLVEILRSSRPNPPFPAPFAGQPPPHPPGPWIDLPYDPHAEPELSWPRWVCRRAGQPALYYPRSGRFLDLSSGLWGDPVGPLADSVFVAVWPDGSKLLSSNHGGTCSLLDLETRGLELFSGPGGAPIGIWPGGQIGFAGHRCVFSWLTFCKDGVGGTLSSCDHDWPCGHEKKQYGYLDNEPCWIQLSGLGDCYLSMYQKDAVISQSLPVGWKVFGQGWAAVAEPAMDSSRALFFTHDGATGQGDPEESEDGDARDLRPTMVLGPDPTCRYALDLQRPVYRIVGETVTPVNETLDGYGVFDSSHQAVRYGSGRLLGGWDRSLVGWEDGRLWREDMTHARRTDLGAESEPISWAFSLPASPNLVLVSQGERTLKVRLV